MEYNIQEEFIDYMDSQISGSVTGYALYRDYFNDDETDNLSICVTLVGGDINGYLDKVGKCSINIRVKSTYYNAGSQALLSIHKKITNQRFDTTHFRVNHVGNTNIPLLATRDSNNNFVFTATYRLHFFEL